MAAYTYLSKILRGGDDEHVYFKCPGCDDARVHGVRVGDGSGIRWGWNGSVDKPTFTPSVLVTFNWGEERTERVCHSFVADGRIQFLSDCTHALAGQTVDIPNWDTV